MYKITIFNGLGGDWDGVVLGFGWRGLGDWDGVVLNMGIAFASWKFPCYKK